MDLLEKPTEDYSSDISETVSHSDIKYDTQHDKLDADDFGRNFDFDKEFAELEILSQEAKQNKTFMQKIISFEIELNFENKNILVWILGAFASAAGLLSGIDQSIISGASIGMDPALNLNDHEASLITALMPLGAMCGSILMSPLNKFFGRKFSIIISCLFYTLGAGLCAGAHDAGLMYAGRFILGIGVGIEGGCVNIYISECVPANVRGNIVSMYQLNIALGEVFGYAVAAIFYEIKGGWRYMLGSSLVFSTILLVGMFFLPESPRYLLHKGRAGEAYDVWKRLRDMNDSRSKLEFMEMRQAAIQADELSKNESKLQLFTDLFRIPRNRRALTYSAIMVTFGQLTGVNAVMYYMSTLMAQIGFDTKTSVFMSLVGGGSLLIGTIPAVLWMDRFGRRTWLYNVIGAFVGLCLVGGGYLCTDIRAAEGVYLTGIIVYFLFFGAYSTLTWVIPSESFDIKTRSIGVGLNSCLLYLWSFTVTYNFTKMQEAMTYTGLTLGFYGGLCFIAIIYQSLFMPETKNKTLEEIDDIFSRSSFSIAGENLRNMKNYWKKRQ